MLRLPAQVAAVGEVIYVVGEVKGANIDPFGTGAIASAESGDETSAFVAAMRIDSTGPVALWTIHLDGAESEPPNQGKGVKASPDGAYLFVTGELKGAAAVGSCTLTGARGGFLLKLDATTGDCLWAKDIPTNNGVLTDGDHVYAFGWGDDPMEYDAAHILNPHPPSPQEPNDDDGNAPTPEYDGFVAKLSASDGTGLWAEGFGGSGNDMFYSGVMTPKGPVFGGRSESDYFSFGGVTINNLEHARIEAQPDEELGDNHGRTMFALMLSATDAIMPWTSSGCSPPPPTSASAAYVAATGWSLDYLL